MLEQYTKSLVHEGFTIVPPHIHNIPTALIEEAGEASISLIKLMANLDCVVNFKRVGEIEPDVGLIHRLPKEGKDIKYFLHSSYDFRLFVERDQELWEHLMFLERELEQLNSMYFELNQLVLRILSHLTGKGLFLSSLVDVIQLYKKSAFSSVPYGTTTLRGLWYPAKENHQGAKGHIDKSLITAHLGDWGGSLFGHHKGESKQSFIISPEPGHILLFWGVKALLLSDGKLKPMWHSASTRPDEDRFANVLFGHVETFPPVHDAKIALADFCKVKRVSDGRQFLA